MTRAGARRARGGAALLLAACATAPSGALRFELPCDQPVCLRHFAFTDAGRWRFDDGALELLGKSDYQPPFRSPHSVALLRDVVVGDFDLDVELLQTGRDYGHRDLCVVFGFESPQRFYYVHMATTPDPNAHNVFLVHDAARASLAAVPADGVDWGRDEWHHVRVERRVGPGTIRVFWDGGAEPILTANDATIGRGRVGFGSFDDAGRVRHVVLTSPDGRLVTGDDPFAR